MKIEKLLDKYRGLDIDEEKFKSFLKREQEKNTYNLITGDECYILDKNGTVVLAHWNESYISVREQGNISLSAKEIVLKSNTRKTEEALLKHGRKEFKKNKQNYVIGYDFENNKFITVCQEKYGFQGGIYFDTKESCLSAMREVGEENIKKYLFPEN